MTSRGETPSLPSTTYHAGPGAVGAGGRARTELGLLLTSVSQGGSAALLFGVRGFAETQSRHILLIWHTDVVRSRVLTVNTSLERKNVNSVTKMTFSFPQSSSPVRGAGAWPEGC